MVRNNSFYSTPYNHYYYGTNNGEAKATLLEVQFYSIGNCYYNCNMFIVQTIYCSDMQNFKTFFKEIYKNCNFFLSEMVDYKLSLMRLVDGFVCVRERKREKEIQRERER